MTTPDPDRADAVHRLLQAYGPAARPAAAAVAELPDGHVLAGITDPETGVLVGHLTAGRLLVDLRDGRAAPGTVWELLEQQGAVRPGLVGRP